MKCSDVTEEYMKITGKSRNTSNNLGKIIRKAFPEARHCHKRVVKGRKRFYVYMNLREKLESVECITFEELPGILTSHSGTVAWSEEDKGWVCCQITEKNIRGGEPVKQVIFKEDRSLTVRLGQYTVPLQRLDLPTKFNNTKTSVLAVLETIDLMQVCNGYKFGNKEYRKSARCHILLNPIKKTDRCTACSNRITLLKSQASATSVASEDSTPDTIALEETNVQDIEDILSRIDPKMAANPNMVELMQCQQQVLSCKGPTGHRWPKR